VGYARGKDGRSGRARGCTPTYHREACEGFPVDIHRLVGCRLVIFILILLARHLEELADGAAFVLCRELSWGEREGWRG